MVKRGRMSNIPQESVYSEEIWQIWALFREIRHINLFDILSEIVFIRFHG